MKIVLGVLVIAGLVVGLLWMQGTFDPKIGPETEVAAPARVGDRPTTEVAEVTMPVYSEAVGTVRSRRTTRVSPRLMATILEIRVSQGDRVAEGDLLVRLDDREVRAGLAAAKADLARARARLTQAKAEYDRTRGLVEKKAATPQKLEQATADFEAAKAAVAGAEQAVEAADVKVGYTEIRAPLRGVVAERLAEPGDLALPGKPLLAIQDETALRLEAEVREYLIPWVSAGTEVSVVFGPPLDVTYETKIEERAPEADPRTRTLLVKAPLPEGSAARPGNFGRLRFRTGERQVLLVPKAAVERVGQLETIRVRDPASDRIRLRHVRTGDAYGDRVEVLAGLSAGELIVAE